MKKCPKCKKALVGIEYGYGSFLRFDGISEYKCMNPVCGYREGRWCGHELVDNELEPRFCEGNKMHPRYTDLRD
jgi:hypothetical protein